MLFYKKSTKKQETNKKKKKKKKKKRKRRAMLVEIRAMWLLDHPSVAIDIQIPKMTLLILVKFYG